MGGAAGLWTSLETGAGTLAHSRSWSGVGFGAVKFIQRLHWCFKVIPSHSGFSEPTGLLIRGSLGDPHYPVPEGGTGNRSPAPSREINRGR